MNGIVSCFLSVSGDESGGGWRCAAAAAEAAGDSLSFCIASPF